MVKSAVIGAVAAVLATLCPPGQSVHYGGTLTLAGSADIDHLDTASGYYGPTFVLERAYSRQLVTAPASRDVSQASAIVADIATEVPTQANGGVSKDGKTYTFHIKPGVDWDAPSGRRQVTAQDEVLGIKRLCNPAVGAGALQYFTDTIVGMKAFCDGFAKVTPDIPSIAKYIQGNGIAGVRAVNDRTVVFQLVQPIPDFLDILALTFASPAPREYLKYLPDSADFRQHVISDGPYRITGYTANKDITLGRNPAWNPRTDQVRKAYVDGIHVEEGLNQQQTFDAITGGAADSQWDVPPPSAQLGALAAAHDPRLEVMDVGLLEPYVAVNMISPNNNGATGNQLVRQALEYAVNKADEINVIGGTNIAQTTCQILAPSSGAYQPFCLYPSAGDQGDPDKAKQLLAQAGYPNGLTLKMIHGDAGTQPAVAKSLQTALARAGITLQLTQVPRSDFYPKYMSNADYARQGAWDIAAVNWRPDWLGDNARTYLSPLLDGSGYTASSPTFGNDYGFYNSPVTNGLLQQAFSSSDRTTANNLFHQAEVQALTDAAVIPMGHQFAVYLHTTALHNANWYPNGVIDPTNVWLDPKH